MFLKNCWRRYSFVVVICYLLVVLLVWNLLFVGMVQEIVLGVLDGVFDWDISVYEGYCYLVYFIDICFDDIVVYFGGINFDVYFFVIGLDWIVLINDDGLLLNVIFLFNSLVL